MKIANFSVNRPVSITMIILAMVILGMFSLPRLAVDLFPDMELPVAVVVTNYPGADPAEVENVVTRPLEQAVANTSGLDTIQSISSTGNSLVVVMFDWNTDMDFATIELREKIDMYRDMLPQDVKSPMVIKMDPNNAPIMLYTITGDDLLELTNITEDTILTRLERIDGVASAIVEGGKEREYKVVLDHAKLESYGIPPAQVAQMISGGDIAGTAGSLSHGRTDLAIRVQSEYKSIADLEEIQIPLGTGASVKLSDIAEIRDDFKEDTAYAYVNDNTALSMAVFKSSGHNTVQVSRAVKAEVERLNESLPEGLELTLVYDSAEFIEDSISNVVKHATVGGVLAMIVLYLFLRNLRSTMVVAISMPIAVIATFTMMYFGNQSINLLSLGGLALGLGSLIDFSVVVLESIYRYREDGYSVIEAAKKGTAEVGNAVLASGTSQVVVFAPIIFVTGLAGILFTPLALTVSFSNVAAMLVAVSLVPMLSSKLLGNVRPIDTAALMQDTSKKPTVVFNKFFIRLRERYVVLLKWSLGHRKIVLVATVILLVVSLALIPVIGAEFMPSMDTGEIVINIETPQGTVLEETQVVATNIENLVKEHLPDRERIFTRVGTNDMAWLGGAGGNEATIQVKLLPQDQRDYTTEEAMEIMRQATKNISGATITIGQADEFHMSGSPVQVIIKGDDLDVLEQLASLITETVSNVEGTRNVSNSLEDARPEVQVTIDREQADLYGLSAHQILTTVNTAFDGQVVGRVRTGEDQIDIRLMYPDDFEQNQHQLASLMITSPTGARVSLGSVADITVSSTPSSITRIDQSRQISITADIFGRDLGSINNDIQAELDKMMLPDGYIVEISGEAEDMAESFMDLGMAIMLAAVLVYMLLASLFESLYHPFVIMFALPPTIVGVVFGLLVTGHTISVVSLIGMIMLIGIVVSNAIVLVDYINRLRSRGLGLIEAILEAAPIRLRPILMTSVTTVLALLPLAFGTGEGSEGYAPMAVVVAFGLTFSTLITLVLVPVVYTSFEDLGTKIKNRLGISKPQNDGIDVTEAKS
ncbi:efflux RND transporter permease subunit [Desulfofalx alkaliphila]|uniref:efflux RND transporter permease subunit n=1 Tax=Desulfofalx alkaliphila TaxID=105483 RepID=UPI0004E0D44B|nr:efflux RND transporter permease subunit [Desulfofalx alkaliphila]